MEKRLKKAPALNWGLTCAKGCAKAALALALFAPALSAVKMLPRDFTDANPTHIVKTVEVRERFRPRDLVRIYSIVRAHRPEVSESEIWRLSEVIHEESSKRNLDPMLVLALIRIESGFRFAAVSPVGARGIMQIMPDTGKFLVEAVAGEYGFHPAAFQPESLDDPILNLRLGIYYLHDLKKQFQHLDVALTAYNFGPGDTQNRLENNIDLAREFAAMVLDAYHRYRNTRHPAF